MPYHELLHYFSALLVPIAEPQSIYWQSTHFRPVTSLKMLPFVVNYESIFQYLLMKLSPLIVSFFILLILMPWVKITAQAFVDRYKAKRNLSEMKVITGIITIEIIMILSSCSSDILSSIQFLNDIIQPHLHDVILAILLHIFILGIGIIVSVLLMKFIIAPEIQE